MRFLPRLIPPLLVCLLMLSAFQSTPPPENNSRIVFTSDQDGTLRLYMMRPDGSDVQLVGSGILEEGGLVTAIALSPDGSKAAFVSRKNRDGIFSSDELFLLDLSSGNITQLTNDSMYKANLLWLADNNQIIYLSGGPEGDYDQVSLIDSVSSEIQIIADYYSIAQSIGSGVSVNIHQMSISPDSQRVLLGVQTSLPDVFNVLVLMNVDGTDIHQVTPNDLISSYPSWNSDPNIVYYICGFEGYHEICRLNLQTPESQIVTDVRSYMAKENEYYINKIDVSRDNQILFQVQFVKNIYLLNPNDGSIVNLTDGSTSDPHLLGWVSQPLEILNQ